MSLFCYLPCFLFESAQLISQVYFSSYVHVALLVHYGEMFWGQMLYRAGKLIADPKHFKPRQFFFVIEGFLVVHHI